MNDLLTCAYCGTPRPPQRLERFEGRLFCHGPNDPHPTCYEDVSAYDNGACDEPRCFLPRGHDGSHFEVIEP